MRRDYEQFIAAVHDRHSGNPYRGMIRRGWQCGVTSQDHRVLWRKRNVTGAIVAVEGDVVWQTDTIAEWRAQNG